MSFIADEPNEDKRVRPTEERVCAVCGKIFWAAVAEVKRIKKRGRLGPFCSRSCGATAANRKKTENKVALSTTDWLQEAYADTYRKAKQKAPQRRKGEGIPFLLTKEEYNGRIERSGYVCALTHLPFENTEVRKFARRPFTPSLDRIDSDGPYSLENCRIVCSALNLAMSDWGLEVVRIISYALIRVEQVLLGAPVTGSHHKVASLKMPDWLKRAYADTYKQAKQNAKRRHGQGIPFLLIQEEFDGLRARCQDLCSVTGIAFTDSEVRKSSRRPFIPSLDRIDPAGPYSVDNCRLVCSAVNLAMNAGGLEAFRRVAYALAQADTAAGIAPPDHT